jgi:hypothetical protein
LHEAIAGAANLYLSNPDGYQKKGVAGEAKRIVVKRRGLAKLDFEGAGNRGKVFGKQNEAELRLSQAMVPRNGAVVNTFLSSVLVSNRSCGASVSRSDKDLAFGGELEARVLVAVPF